MTVMKHMKKYFTYGSLKFLSRFYSFMCILCNEINGSKFISVDSVLNPCWEGMYQKATLSESEQVILAAV